MSKIINISLPEELVKKVDEAAKSEYSSRSDYIRDSLVRRLKHQRIVDEWGDDGEWETVADLANIKPQGIPVAEVIATIQSMTK